MMEEKTCSKSWNNFKNNKYVKEWLWWLNLKACFYIPCHNKRVSSSEDTSERKEILKEAINFHFKSHWKRWKDEKKPRFPLKVFYHVALVALVIAQVSCPL